NTASLFPSVYTGNVALQYQLPLLAGSGTEFTRIAGPIGQQFGGLTGVSQGVVIARINNDIAIADFEAAVRNLTKDVEDTYWDLYLAYRNFHTAVTARDAALGTWRTAQIQLEAGTRTRAEVAQARDQLFAAEAAVENSRSSIYSSEIRLRRLMGMAVNDGATLRPADEPVTAELVPDWYASLTEALSHRVELRRQKWSIRSLCLQLKAARSLTRPRLDALGGYQVNGFGDHLFANTDADVAGTPHGLNDFYETITQGDETGWNLGLQMSMPFGFRSAHAQVRNYEIRLAKAEKVLQEQEREISHELAIAFQELARSYSTAQKNLNRLLAARENVKYLEPNVREGDKLLDDLLRAQARQAEAEVAYYQSLVDYNKALVALEFRKGVLLEHNNIFLAEGGWLPEAYDHANRQGEARAHAWPNEMLEAQPAPFAYDGPTGGVYHAADEAIVEPLSEAPPEEVAAPPEAPAPPE
ncbi:MAG: TolC family protein, partial [Planctomycetaceae bacterium]|nr:TolC family protein [Planctomycetaceae bacterium]